MKCIGKVRKTIYRNNETYFTIAAFELVKELEGKVVVDRHYKTFTATGLMPYLLEGSNYTIEGSETEHPTYGTQYNLKSISLYLKNGLETKEGRRDYLCVLFTENQVESMYEALEDPYQSLYNRDTQSLVKVSGCGMKTAVQWMERFHNYMPLSNAITDLKEYGITDALLRKITAHYKSPDIAVEIIKNNPYKLIEVKGVGWKKCDEIAIKGGMDPHSPERISAYMMEYLSNKAEEGYSFVPVDLSIEQEYGVSNKTGMPINFIDTIVKFFGDDLTDADIGKGLCNISDKLWFDEKRHFIGLQKVFHLENSVAEELIRLRDGENDFQYANWKAIISKKEELQGWKYNEQQIKGVEAVLKNQVVVITGKAGTGKSSIVSAMLSVLSGYEFAQTALSGRAAARMAEITGEEGYTIHRLLGFPKGDDIHGGWLYNEDNKLPYEIVIVDEVSMIDGNLFLRLLKALKTGTKLIMLGDTGQLECIGCMNIASDLIESDEIKSVVLTKIHRQAADSAIITESEKVRDKIQLIPKDWVGVEIRGKRKDLLLDSYTDKSNTFYRVMQYVAKELSQGTSIMDLMVIVANRKSEAGVYNLNAAIQELYNPSSPDKEEIECSSPDNVWTLREGDKVINVRNNYYISNKYQTGIYNGNIGVITKIDKKEKIVEVDFQDFEGLMEIPQKDTRALELGYCITCHKAQGSQCKNVIVGLDFGSFTQLSKEWVYTALTRAEEQCYLVAQNNALRYAVMQDSISVKLTHLKQALSWKSKNKFHF